MRFIILPVLCLFLYVFCNAQNKNGVYPKSLNPKAGIDNDYFYVPPKGLLLPLNMQVLVVYESSNKFYKEKVPLTMVDENYHFSFKAPDSTAVLICAIVNQKKKPLQTENLFIEKEVIVDNNKEKGFIINLHNKKGRKFDFSGISLANLLNYYAVNTLQLKPVAKDEIIKIYESAYNYHPAFKHLNSYSNYLKVLYEEKPAMAKPKLLDFAKELIKSGNEANLVNAKKIYGILKNKPMQKQVEQTIMIKFPNGELAKENFWDSLNNKNDNTEESVLLEMSKYIKRFKDSSSHLKDKFYDLILSKLINKNEFEKLEAYENLYYDKFKVVFLNNYYAWKLAGKGLDNPAKSLPAAKSLSAIAIGYIDSMIKAGMKTNSDGEDLNSVRDMNLNTYALVLYKLGQYDSAYYYQNSIYRRGEDLLDDKGYERLIAYMEKVKSIDSTKDFIENKLINGLNSTRALQQLQLIYKKLNLPVNNFEKLKVENDRSVKKRNAESIKEKMGTIVAKDFLLKNIMGEQVSLSAFRNKVVVLDFWATWCGPCKASFPQMQELINKYKADTGVVFLFIDTWESTPPAKLKKEVKEYLQENKFTFNVLFDEINKTARDYKVESIPHKIIINKNGDMVFIEGHVDNFNDFSGAIELAKK